MLTKTFPRAQNLKWTLGLFMNYFFYFFPPLSLPACFCAQSETSQCPRAIEWMPKFDKKAFSSPLFLLGMSPGCSKVFFKWLLSKCFWASFLINCPCWYNHLLFHKQKIILGVQWMQVNGYTISSYKELAIGCKPWDLVEDLLETVGTVGLHTKKLPITFIFLVEDIANCSTGLVSRA